MLNDSKGSLRAALRNSHFQRTRCKYPGLLRRSNRENGDDAMTPIDDDYLIADHEIEIAAPCRMILDED
jgi:hypothetical protein